jgi:oligopeptidase B
METKRKRDSRMQQFLSRRNFAFGLTAIGAYLTGRKSGIAAAKVKMPGAPSPPMAPAALKFEAARSDPYDWLRNREDPRVVAYLNEENAYTDALLKPIRPLLDELTAELQQRTTPADASVPTAYNGYVYQRRFVRGSQYPVIVRWKDITEDSEEEVILDVGALAAGHRRQWHLGSWTVSPDNRRVAFTVDFNGDGQFRVFVRTLSTGKVDDQGMGRAASSLVFGADSESLFYVRNDPVTVRASQVWRHRIGSDTTTDVLIYEEKDPTFSVGLALSKSRKFVLLHIEAEHTSEVRYLPVKQSNGELKVIEPRRSGVMYEIDHAGDQFFIRTNVNAPDFRMMIASEINPEAANWKEIIPQKTGHYLSHFEAFDTFVAVEVEDEVGTKVRVFNFIDAREITVPHPAGIGVASISFDHDNEANVEPALTVLRFRFSGPVHPECIYDFDLTSGILRLRKQDPAIRWFDRNKYAIDRLDAIASDGETVPITIVYHKDMRQPGGNPTLIEGYGAYGLSMHPTFTPSIVSLLDRGFIHAIAHVRGGREKGDRWYREGRLLNKRNTFTDFIAATETLIAQGYADRRAVFAQGGSAGGLVMGVIANLRPELYAGIVAEVPFVDVITTMSDPSLPLTTLEYEEWGNPAVKREYDYMLSYSPYDNVVRKNYPAMYVSAAFYDSQVSYAEPAKWVARLRASKTDPRDLLLRTDMDAGHQGRSGRGGSTSQNAEIIGWLIAHAREPILQ